MLFIDLTASTPVAHGEMREVHPYPDRPDLLIKVFRTKRVDERGDLRNRKWYKPHGRYGAYEVIRREFLELIGWSHRFHGSPGTLPPFAAIVGFISTTAGGGLVVEAIRDAQGALAPSITDLIRSGRFGAEHQAALDRLFETCKREHVVLTDGQPQNLLYTTARSGRPEVVSIDGIGEKAVIPIHLWSKALNARRLERTRTKTLRIMARIARTAV